MADFNITLIGSDSTKGSYVPLTTPSGFFSRVATDADNRAFGIDGDSVKRAIGQLWGRQPDDVVFHDPTPRNWPNMSEYGWQPVTLCLQPTSIQEGDVQLTHAVLQTKSAGPLREDGTVEITFDTKVDNTTEVSWSQTSSLEISQEIGFDIKFFSSGTRLQFTQEWQKGGSKSQEFDVSSGDRITVALTAGQVRAFTNIALVGTSDVTVKYSAYLSGGFFVNYGDPYAIPGTSDRHHFYYCGVGDVLTQLGKSNSFESVQVISNAAYQFSSVSEIDPPQSDSLSDAEKLKAIESVDKVFVNRDSYQSGDRMTSSVK